MPLISNVYPQQNPKLAYAQNTQASPLPLLEGAYANAVKGALTAPELLSQGAMALGIQTQRNGLNDIYDQYKEITNRPNSGVAQWAINGLASLGADPTAYIGGGLLGKGAEALGSKFLQGKGLQLAEGLGVAEGSTIPAGIAENTDTTNPNKLTFNTQNFIKDQAVIAGAALAFPAVPFIAGKLKGKFNEFLNSAQKGFIKLYDDVKAKGEDVTTHPELNEMANKLGESNEVQTHTNISDAAARNAVIEDVGSLHTRFSDVVDGLHRDAISEDDLNGIKEVGEVLKDDNLKEFAQKPPTDAESIVPHIRDSLNKTKGAVEYNSQPNPNPIPNPNTNIKGYFEGSELEEDYKGALGRAREVEEHKDALSELIDCYSEAIE